MKFLFVFDIDFIKYFWLEFRGSELVFEFVVYINDKIIDIIFKKLNLFICFKL